ncbi:kinetochore protein isoform X2 [Tasmannia lanceolata]|uniref:kinetochore protein isoform X2 n=1 Tax=Tasmannia lanceolata TaxID=3420 RepID=UPI0040642BBA
MQREPKNPIQRKMAELRSNCVKNIQIRQQISDSAMDTFRKSLQSIKISGEETGEDQVKLGKLKDCLRELEDDLVKTLAVKTCKEAKRLETIESYSAAKSRIEELKKIVQDQQARRDEYKRIISQQLLALEQKSNQDINHTEDIEEAILWYNTILGFRIEGGHGVKFIFNKIDLKNPNKEYSFIIRHENNTYTLSDCDPYLENTEELIQELNQTNGLFKFVRIMRERFLMSASNGLLHLSTFPHPDSATITLSAPASSISVSSRSESLTKQNEFQVERRAEVDRPPKKINHGRGHKLETVSPKSASSVRRSPRTKARK